MNVSTLPIKRIANVTLGKMIQATAKPNGGKMANYLRAAHVQPTGRVVDVEEKQMWFSTDELAELTLRKGDVVVVEGGAGYGRAAHLRKDLNGWGFQNSIVRIRSYPSRGDGRFVAYALQSALSSGAISAACYTATIPHFTADKVGAFEVPAPSLSEQQAIADYLDRETQRIDELIAEQRGLIETLRERRVELISQAVTRGLEGQLLGDVPMPWIGRIPVGWKRGRIKHLGDVTLGKMLQSRRTGDDVEAPYMRAANVQPDGVIATGNIKTMWFKPSELRSLDLRKGDVVVVEGGVGGYGRAAFLQKPLVGWGFQNSINRLFRFQSALTRVDSCPEWSRQRST